MYNIPNFRSPGNQLDFTVLKQASSIIEEHLTLFANVGDVEPEVIDQSDTIVPPDIYNMVIERLELSSRTQNSLRRAGLKTVGEILERTQDELMKVRNFGERSFNELIACFQEREYMFENTILSDSFKTEIDEDVEE